MAVGPAYCGFVSGFGSSANRLDANPRTMAARQTDVFICYSLAVVFSKTQVVGPGYSEWLGASHVIMQLPDW